MASSPKELKMGLQLLNYNIFVVIKLANSEKVFSKISNVNPHKKRNSPSQISVGGALGG